MPTTWQTVRVFISSTFRDMHSERDWLVKRVFPALRERLDEYRVHLIDIDLRWGVTKEQSDNDEALDVCLEQIDECRPFFLGILGERYGYVSHTLPDRVASKWGWIRHHTKKSITELEILHGVLRDPEMHPWSFFCFRDPAFLDDVPRPLQANLKAEDEDSAEKLRALKAAIDGLQPPLPILKHYPCEYAGLKIDWGLAKLELSAADQQALQQIAADRLVDPQEYAELDDHLREIVHRFGNVRLEGLKEFGVAVQAWLWKAIKKRLNLADQPTAAVAEGADRGLDEERSFHERFIESRTRVYVGRQVLQNELMNYANGSEEHPCLVTGESGSGKSAALAKFAATLQSQIDSRQSSIFLVPHFIGASPASTGLRQTLHRLCSVLKSEFAFAEDVPPDTNSLIGTFRQFLGQVPADRRVVLVLDALNQLDEAENAQQLYWLPWQLPPHVKLVASCIRDPAKEEPVLKAFEHRPHPRIEIPPLTDAERRAIIKEVPKLAAKTLDDQQIRLLLSNPATHNPLFLLVALEELRGFGSYEQLRQRMARMPRPPELEPRWVHWLADARSAAETIPDERARNEERQALTRVEATFRQNAPVEDPLTEIFLQVIERLEDEFDPAVARSVLSLLASARRGLSDRELLDLIENQTVATEESTSDLFPVLRQLRPYLQPRGELLDFYHRNLFKAVRQKYLDSPRVDSPRRKRAAHVRLADYFRGQDYFQEFLEEHRARATRLPDRARTANVRKVDELPWQLLEAARQSQSAQLHELDTDHERIETLFQELPFLEAKTEAGLVFELVEDFTSAVEVLPDNRPQRRVLKLLHEALRLSSHVLAQDSRQLPGQLLGRLLGQNMPELQGVLEQCRDWDEAPWLRPLIASLTPPGGPLLHTLAAHDGAVDAVAVTPDGRRAISASWDKTLKVWDLASGAECLTLKGHDFRVNAVAVTPDGRRAISGSYDQTLKVWDLATSAECFTLKGHDGFVSAVAVTPDGRQAISASGDMTLKVWDLATGAECLTFTEHGDLVLAVAATPDGRRAISASSDKTLKVWDLATGAECLTLKGHGGWVSAVAVTPDGRRAISASSDKTLKVWDLATGAECLTLNGHGDRVNAVAVTPDGRRAISASSDKTLKVWDLATGAECLTLKGHGDLVLAVAVTPDGRRAISASVDKTLNVWGLATGAECLKLKRHDDRVNAVAVTPDGRRAISASDDKTLKVWDLATGAECLTLKGHDGGVRAMAMTPDGRRAISESGKTLKVWDLATGAECFTLKGHDIGVNAVAVTPDGRRAISGSYDRTLKVWDLATGAECFTLKGHDGFVHAVAVTPDGRRAISASDDKTLKVWDLASGAECLTLKGHRDEVSAVAVTPDGRWAISASEDETLKVWDLASGAECLTLKGHRSWVSAVAVTPDGRRAISASYDKTLKVWNLASGAGCLTLKGHDDVVSAVAVTPDGRRAISASKDRTIKVWDVETGEVIASFSADAPVKACAVSSQTIIAGDAQGWVHMLRLEEP